MLIHLWSSPSVKFMCLSLSLCVRYFLFYFNSLPSHVLCSVLHPLSHQSVFMLPESVCMCVPVSSVSSVFSCRVPVSLVLSS